MNIAPPNCPKCGSPMLVKTAKKGKNIGKKFYGCSTFPKCWKRMAIANTASEKDPADSSGTEDNDIEVENINSYPEELRQWLRKTEPIFRKLKERPQDWKYRVWFVRLRDGNKCQECERTNDRKVDWPDQFHTHHKIYLSEGGDNSLENLAYICRRCHEKHHRHLAWVNDSDFH